MRRYGAGPRLVLAIALAVVVGCNGGGPVSTPGQEGAQSHEADKPAVETPAEAGKSIVSKVIHLQLTADDPPKCVVVPEELEMMESGIAWVTWVNATGQDAEIHFLDGGAIGNTDPHAVPAGTALTLRLTNPAPAQKTQHEYGVKVEGYEQPIAGPKIIVP